MPRIKASTRQHVGEDHGISRSSSRPKSLPHGSTSTREGARTPLPATAASAAVSRPPGAGYSEHNDSDGDPVVDAHANKRLNKLAPCQSPKPDNQRSIICRRSLVIGTQNIHGTQGQMELNGSSKDLGKIEILALQMRKDQQARSTKGGEPEPQVEFLQETWLTGTFESRIHGVLVLHHGPDKKPNRRGSGGVAILLNRQAEQAWNFAGRPDPFRPGSVHPQDLTCRIIGITLRFPSKSKTKAKSESLFLCNVYAPDSGTLRRIEQHAPGADLYQRVLDTVEEGFTLARTQFGTDTKLVVGGDLNASLGVRRDETDPAILGPYGISHNNERGDDVLAFAGLNGLRVYSTFFRSRIKNHPYATFFDQLHNRRPLQLDHFLASQSLGARVHNCGVYLPVTGVPSDHRPVRIRICLEKTVISRAKAHSLRQRKQNRVDTFLNWRLLHLELPVTIEYQKRVRTKLSRIDPSTATPAHYSDAIIAAATETISRPREPTTSWFSEHEETLAPLRTECQRLYNLKNSDQPPRGVKANYKAALKAYKAALKDAKAQYSCALAKTVSWRDICGDSRKAWQIIRQLESGSYAHHRPATEDMVLNDPITGATTSEPKNVLRIVANYAHKLYNRDDAPVDPTVLDDIDQRDIAYDLDSPPTITELTEAINSQANNKAPGASGVPAEALKALPKTEKAQLLPLFTRYWCNEISPQPDETPNATPASVENYEEWTTAILRLLYKNKGSAKLLANYRGIVLQDIFARIMSAILAQRLARLLQRCGIEEQFGSQAGRGTTDANWVLRSLLGTRKAHGIDSHVLFVDLIKAFDTANHDLLFDLLGKFGAPPALVSAVRRLHRDFALKFTLDARHACEILYTVGVRQGDNMAPILFLFLMQAFAESTRKAWQRTRMPPAVLTPVPDEVLIRGELVSQNISQPGHMVEIPFTIFVDDTAFVFDTWEEMRIHLPFLQHQFRRFGLLMHVGTRDLTTDKMTPSKTECMYFPARPGNMKDQELILPQLNFGDHDQFFVHYTDSFKYLGSRLVPTLSDGPEIHHRIRLATAQVNALMNFWRSSTELRTKRMIFQAIPLNTAIYGCEYWALNDTDRRALKVFQTKTLRKILGISMKRVEAEHITNVDLHNKLCVDNILDIIEARQASYLGKLAGMPTNRLPRQMLGAWLPWPRKQGPLGATLPRTAHTTLDHVLQMDNTTLIAEDRLAWQSHGPLRLWIPEAQNRHTWKNIICSNLVRRRRDTWKRDKGTLGPPVLPKWHAMREPNA